MSEVKVKVEKGSREIRLHGELYEEEECKIVKALQEMNDDEPRDPIDLYISSYGGLSNSFTAIYDVINSLDCEVNTIGIGKCMSAGAFLLMAGTGERKVYKNTDIMIHELQCGISWSSITDVSIRTEYLKRVNSQVISIASKCTGQSEERIEKDLKRDKYMTAEEAKEYGIIDTIIGED